MYAFTYPYAILKSKGSDCMFDEHTLTEPAKMLIQELILLQITSSRRNKTAFLSAEKEQDQSGHIWQP